MEQTIVIVSLFVLCFASFKYFEYTKMDLGDDDRRRPLKYITRDLVFGTISAAVASSLYFAYEQPICAFFNIITGGNGENIATVSPHILIGDPGF